jgi:hypothetical protein
MKNPKEKAKELVELFWTEVEDNKYTTRKMSYNQAKQCALIAVDEVINNDEYLYLGQKKNIEYWQQVKTEINLL